MDVETHKVGSPDVVVPTIDTVRHESLLYTWLADHKPMVLCGPPGSVGLLAAQSLLFLADCTYWINLLLPLNCFFCGMYRVLLKCGVGPRLHECRMQGQKEIESNSRHNIHQTWGPP